MSLGPWTLALMAAFGPFEEEQGGGELPGPGELGPSRPTTEQLCQEAIQRGLAYLARRQRETADGSFPRGPRGETRDWAPVGVCALGSLAYMAHGNLPGRGPYGAEVAKAIDYLVNLADMAPGSPTRGYISLHGDKLSRTHGHGFATLALAEAYGMSPRGAERLESVLEAAVRRIEQSQGTEGGWEYEPRAVGAHEGSITICYAQALRAARNAGIQVSGDVIFRAEDYVKRLQKKDGTFRYQLDREDSSVALTAAGISTLNMAGRYDGQIIQNGVDAITTLLDKRGERSPKFPFYERLYLAQAFWQLTDRSLFERWFEKERLRLMADQQEDGSWTDPSYGNCYATAVNCLVLSLPAGVLPILQR